MNRKDVLISSNVKAQCEQPLLFFFLSASCFESVPELSLWQQEGKKQRQGAMRGVVGWVRVGGMWGGGCRSHYR